MGVTKARRVFLVAPRKIEVRDQDLEPMDRKSVLVRSILSGISHGTEMAVYRGTAPTITKSFDREKRLFPDVEEAKEIAVRGMGYENVGEVIEVGPDVTTFKVGDLLWCWAPHMSHYVFEEGKPAVGWPPPLGHYSAKLPKGGTPEQGIFTALANVALTAVHDAAVKVGDYVAVTGGGTIGLLCAQIALLNGARKVYVSEPLESRRQTAQELGAIPLDPAQIDVGLFLRQETNNRGADVAIEASGNQKALHQAIRCTGMGGRVVTLSFYQGGAPDVRLGEEWHHNRTTMISSMSAWHCPSRYYPQWEILRSFETVLDLMARGKLKVEQMISHKIPLERAAEAYELVDKHTQDVLKVAISYP